MHDLVVPADLCIAAGGQRLTRGAAVRTLTLDQLKAYDCGSLGDPRFPAQRTVPGARIPTLDEVLALVSKAPALSSTEARDTVASPVQLNIETKIVPGRADWTPSPERFAELVVAVIRRHGLEKRTVIQSFDQRTLQVVARIAPDIRRSLLIAGNLIDHVAAAKAARASIVSPAQDWITRSAVRKIHDAGLTVVPWTANTPDRWQRLVDLGVDGIITDDPKALLSWLRAHGRHR
jgi:glycerophosphoryl diester phosphodiesterase